MTALTLHNEVIRRKVHYMALDPFGGVHSIITARVPHYKWAAVAQSNDGVWRVLGWSHSRRGAWQITKRALPGEPRYVVFAIERRQL